MAYVHDGGVWADHQYGSLDLGDVAVLDPVVGEEGYDGHGILCVGSVEKG